MINVAYTIVTAKPLFPGSDAPGMILHSKHLDKFRTTSPKGSECADACDEESLYRARSCLMERIHSLNEISFHARKHASILVGKQLKFEEAFQVLKGMHVIHEKLEGEAKNLCEEVLGLSERNK
ncbi:unnamed protein product [Lactuca saligna]|uniref:Uncharacterized protein n=1 Tax=Lactuca saligna TaxID=75948 RepID=A0AA35YHH2_LACSI|nr:unnamed protein product [Lactuca saligna]